MSGNVILLGGVGDDTSNGYPGNDLIDGGLGGDALRGEAGNGTFIVENLGDVVTRSSSQGTDTVRSGVDFTLPVNVEHLVPQKRKVVRAVNSLRC